MNPRLAVALLTILIASCATTAHAAVLVDQYSNANTGVVSQDVHNNGVFDPVARDSQLADDFVVPPGETWSITGVDAHGHYFKDGTSSAGPAQSVDVYIYPGSSISGTTPVARTGQAWTDLSGGDGQLRISLSSPVRLTAGTYWVSVWARQLYTTNGYWGWSTRTFQTGSSAVAYYWGFYPGCDTVAWHQLKACYPSPDFSSVGPDLVWRLNGVKKDTLSYQTVGSGTGTVTSSPGGINCQEDQCTTPTSSEFDDGTQVTLTERPSISDVFTGWTGCDQPNGNTCVMNMNSPGAAKTVKATFVEGARLSFKKTGDADGRVVPSSGATCEIGDCWGSGISWKFVKGSVATITAFSTTEAVFAGWTGCDHPSKGVCTMEMTGPKSLSARFAPATGLTIQKEGEGDGTVVSDPPPLDCQLGECKRATFFRMPSNTSVTITAAPSLDSPPSTFAGWTGCDHPSGTTCVMDMGAPGAGRTLKARFNPGKVVTVSKTGSGTGTVTSGVAGIDCGPLCRNVFEPNSAVTLTARPDAGSTFTGWSGACSGTGDCVVVLDDDRVVAASFSTTAGATDPPPPPPPPPASTIPNSQPGAEQARAEDTGRVLVAEGKAIKLKKGKAPIPFQCTATEQCSVRMQLQAVLQSRGRPRISAAAKATAVGSGSLKLKPGKKGTVQVKLTRAAVKQIKKKKKLKVTIKTVVKAGNTKVTIETKTTLKR